ncbi:MAG TPA: MFS transporter, partial [Cytophagales bacterium]|nr:MFS transporter [Cytophagales bacterium]
MSTAAKKVLPLIVLAQFACTSLWFAGNAVLPELQKEFELTARSLGDLTSSVQFGFIVGTLVFALLTISDRFSPSKVFFVCALAGALVNFSITFVSSGWLLFPLRGFVGFFLAGIYPVGMKISSDYFEKGLGKAL